MRDRFTTRGRVLLTMGAAGSVIAATMTAAAIGTSAAVNDISLNPSTTAVNLLDVPGYNTYVPITATPQYTDYTGTWRLDLSNLTPGRFPTVMILNGHIDDTDGVIGTAPPAITASDVQTVLGPSDVVSSTTTHELFELTGYNPASDTILISGYVTAPSAATATIFQDVNHNGIDAGDHTATPVQLNFLDPSQLALHLTAPTAITGGDRIDSVLSISPTLAPNVLGLLDANHAVNFEYFDQRNDPFLDQQNPDYQADPTAANYDPRRYLNTFTGALQPDGTFAGHSAATDPRAAGLYKTRASVLGTLTTKKAIGLDSLLPSLASIAPVGLTGMSGVPQLPPLPPGSVPTAVAGTMVSDFNVGTLEGVTTPDGPNTINVGRRLEMPIVAAAAQLCPVTRCAYGDFELVRSGTHAVTYSATARSNGEHPFPVARVPVEFVITGDLTNLTTNLGPIPASGVVQVPAGADGTAYLTVISSTAKAGDTYRIEAVANGIHSHALCVVYMDAKPFQLKTTKAVQAVKTGGDAYLTSQVLDQWYQPLTNTNGYSVMYIDPYGLAHRFGFSFKDGVLTHELTDPDSMTQGRNAIFGMVQVGSDGKTVAPFKIHDMPVSSAEGTYLDNLYTDGMDKVYAFLLNVSDPDLSTLPQMLPSMYIAANKAIIQWVQDPNPSFLTMDKANTLPWTHRFDSESQQADEMISAPVSIPVDADMGTYSPRFKSSLVLLTVEVTNNELPHVGLGGIPVTFTGPAGSSFAPTFPATSDLPTDYVHWHFAKPADMVKGSLTVLTDVHGIATVWATATKTGADTFTASAGSLSDAYTQGFVNLPQDVRNLTVSSTPASFIAGGASTSTATARDIYGNPVPYVPVEFGLTGVGRFLNGDGTWRGSHADEDWTALDGTALASVVTATNDVGTATVTAAVEDLVLDRICNDTQIFDEFGNYVGIEVAKDVCTYDESPYDHPLQDTFSQISDPAGFIYDRPVAGVAAGNGSASTVLTVGAIPPPPAPPAPVTNNTTNNTTNNNTTIIAPPSTLPSSGTLTPTPTPTPKPTVKPVVQKPGKPSVSSPKKGQLAGKVQANPKSNKLRVDWYLVTSKGKVGKYLGSTLTNSKGLASLLVKKGLTSKTKYRVVVYVHGISGKVYGNWSPISGWVKIK